MVFGSGEDYDEWGLECGGFESGVGVGGVQGGAEGFGEEGLVGGGLGEMVGDLGRETGEEGLERGLGWLGDDGIGGLVEKEKEEEWKEVVGIMHDGVVGFVLGG